MKIAVRNQRAGVRPKNRGCFYYSEAIDRAPTGKFICRNRIHAVRSKISRYAVRSKDLALLVILFAAITACTSNAKPSPSPTPTNITSGFRGPVLGGSDADQESEACSEESGCGLTDDTPVEMDSAPLTLIQQEAGIFNIGIPEGYAPIILDGEILIRASSPDTLGGFTVSLREIDSAQLPDLLERFGGANFEEGTPVQHATLAGNILSTGEYGVIVLLTAEGGRQIFVEAFAASPAYWEAFRATFDAMLESLTYISGK